MTLGEQFYTMVAMVTMGGWFGIALSTYHRFVHPRKKWQWLMIGTDILFWIVQGLLAFYVLLYVDEGEIRFYVFIALACGFAGYKALIQNIYERLLERIINTVIYIYDIVKKIFYQFLVQPTFGLLKLVYELGKIVTRLLLSIVIFVLTAIYLPLKWIVFLFIPKQWRMKLWQWLRQIKPFLGQIKTFFIKVKDFLFKLFKRLR